MSQKVSTRQLRQHTVLPMIGNSADETGDLVLSKIDAQLGKLFEDRNMLLTGGGTILNNSGGTSVSFSADLVLYVNQNVAGAAPYAISLTTASSPLVFSADGRMAYLVVNRVAQTATFTGDAASLPAAVAANQEIVMIAKRVGTNIFFKGGFVLAPSASMVLGRGGSVIDTEFVVNDSSDPTKQIAFDAGGTTGTKTTLISAQTANRNITYPDATTTLVGTDNAQTISNKILQYSTADDGTATGANATLSTITSGIVRLTNSSLTSVSGIPNGSSGKILTVENKTGVQITINNEETGTTAANRVLTGSNSNVTMPNNATYEFVYDSTSSRWMLKGGTGSGSGTGGINLVTGGNAEAGVAGWTTYGLSEAVTFQDTGDTVTLSAHAAYETVAFTSITSTTGISINTLYYVVNSTANTFQLSLTRGGAAIALTTNGSGTMVRGRPVTGAGGSGSSITWATTTTNPLNDLSSFTYAKAAAMAMGQGVSSPAYSLPLEFRAKPLSVSAPYIVDSGTFNAASGSGLTMLDSDAIIYFYDVTNSKLVEPSSFKFLSNSTTVSEKINATVQFDSNCTSFRMLIHTATVNASAFTLKLDDLSVSPNNPQYVTPITDWQNYTMPITDATGANVKSASPSTNSYRWRRVGQNIEIVFTYYHAGTTGTTGSGIYRFGLPPGITVDNNLNVAAGNSTAPHGVADMDIGGANRIKFSIRPQPGTSYFELHVGIPDGSTGYTTTVGSTNGGTGTNYQFGQANVAVGGVTSIPVNGWSSSVQMSSETDTRVVLASATGDPASASSGNPIIFASTEYDTHGGYNSSTGRYTVQVAGYYEISLNSVITPASVSYFIYKNAVLGKLIGSGNGNMNAIALKGTVLANSGDILDVRPNGTVDLGTGTIEFKRISGPSAIAESEKITLRYVNTAATSIPNTGENLVPFATKDYDSHGCWSTNIFTAPRAGKYRVNVDITFTGLAYGAGNNVYVTIYKNGASYSYGPFQQLETGATVAKSAFVNTEIECRSGDTLQIYALNTRTAGASALTPTLGLNHITISSV